MAYGLEFLYLPGSWSWAIHQRDSFEGIAAVGAVVNTAAAGVLHAAAGAVDQARRDNLGELGGLEDQTAAQYLQSGAVSSAIAAVDGVHLEDDWGPADQAAADRDAGLDTVNGLMVHYANVIETPTGPGGEPEPGEPPIEHPPD